MGQIISATTRFDSQAARRRDDFIAKARVLLSQAEVYRAKGQLIEALDVAYQAALRLAGARIADSAVARRRRGVPSGAWEQLKLVDDAGVAQAEEFAVYSRLRSRLLSGAQWEVSEVVVDELIGKVSEFLGAVEGSLGWSMDAA